MGFLPCATIQRCGSLRVVFFHCCGQERFFSFSLGLRCLKKGGYSAHQHPLIPLSNGIWILWVTPQRTDWSWFSIFAISGQSHNVKKCHWKRKNYIYLIHVKPHHVSWLPSGKHTKKRWNIMSFNRSIHIPFGYLTLPWTIITFNRYIIYFYGSWNRYVK